jgi:hypothetical protein
LVGDRRVRSGKEKVHAAIGSAAAARSDGGEAVVILDGPGDTVDIPPRGQEVGPEIATEQGRGTVIWLDALETLPTAADPDAQQGTVDPEADPLVASDAGRGVQVGPVLEDGLDHAAEGLNLEKVGPSVGAAEGASQRCLVGEVEENRAHEELLEPLAQGVGSAVRSAALGSDEEVDCAASLPATCSVSGSCSTGVQGTEEELLAWGKKEEYFQVSISEVELGGPKRAAELFASEQHPRLESVERELLSSPCMSFTGPNNDMQMVPRRQQKDPVLQEAAPEGFAEGGMAELELQQERLALGHIKLFCASILKKLAPRCYVRWRARLD